MSGLDGSSRYLHNGSHPSFFLFLFDASYSIIFFMKKTIEIEIVSDAVCPWCYLGIKRLEKAMSELAEKFQFILFWKPFQLHPDIPLQGLPGNSLLEEKYGKQVAGEMLTNMTRLGKTEGIEFKFSEIPLTPNTKEYHRLIRYAGIFNKQDLLVKSLFKAFFEMGENISNREILLKHAESVGLNGEETSKFLNSSDFIEDIISEEEMYRNAGVRGVPAYILNRKYLIVGAQTSEYFKSAFLELEKTEGII